MSAIKDQVVSMVRELPDSSTLDEIMEELYFKAQVDAGIRELDEGKGIPHQDIERRMSKWLHA